MKMYSENIIVKNDHIDVNLHVNNVVYVQWMQDVATKHSNFVNDILEDTETWVIKSHSIDYIGQAFKNDEILMQTWVESFRKTSCIREYRFIKVKDNQLLVKASTVYVFMDKIKSRPIRIPTIVRSLYED